MIGDEPNDDKVFPRGMPVPWRTRLATTWAQARMKEEGRRQRGGSLAWRWRSYAGRRWGAQRWSWLTLRREENVKSVLKQR
jgi:hypothetical protein